MDTKEFVKEGKKTAAGIRAQKKAFADVITPVEKYKLELLKLKKLQTAGLVTGEAYRRKLDQITKNYRKATKSATLFGRATKGISANLAGLAAGVSFGAATRFLERSIERIDKINKTAEKLGISNEFLTRIQFTAKAVSGLADEATAKGLEKMTRRLSEASVGAGEAQNVLKELGLDAKTILKDGPEAAFFRIARAMDKVTDESDRLRIATKLFDDEQAGLHTTLKLTNAEFDEFEKRGRELGIVLNQDAKAISATAQAIQELKDAFSGAANSLVIEFNPAIRTGIDYMTAAADNFRKRPLSAISGVSFLEGSLKEFFTKPSGPVPAEATSATTAASTGNEKETVASIFRFIRGEAEQTAGLTAQVYSNLSRRMQYKFGQAFLAGNPMGSQVAVRATRIEQRRTDPMASVTRGSSEAFKIANRIKAGKTVEQKAAIDTARNTEESNNWLRAIANEFTDAQPVGL